MTESLYNSIIIKNKDLKIAQKSKVCEDKMRIAVVDDIEDYRNALGKLLEECCKKHSLSIEIDFYKDGIESIEKKEIVYDLIYFDIKMDFVDGMEAAREIRKRDNEVVIVFCTNYVQYAIDGYSVNATDFLVKPISEFAFYEHFKKILPKILRKDEPSLLVKTKMGVRKIKFKNIIYLESDGHYIKAVTVSEEVVFLDTLKNLEGSLDNDIFFRSNSCYIVNLAFVKEVIDNYATVGNFKLQVSRSRKKAFLEALTTYMGDDI
ncbi:MAG: LytR/AlgR family response regulator transcription factor [Lachnospirales bacterium]